MGRFTSGRHFLALNVLNLRTFRAKKCFLVVNLPIYILGIRLYTSRNFQPNSLQIKGVVIKIDTECGFQASISTVDPKYSSIYLGIYNVSLAGNQLYGWQTHGMLLLVLLVPKKKPLTKADGGDLFLIPVERPNELRLISARP